MVLWLALLLVGAGRCLELAAQHEAVRTPVSTSELRMRLSALDAGGQRVAVALRPGGMMIAGHGEDLRHRDLGLLAGRDWLTGFDLAFDRERNVVTALPLVGRSGEAERLGAAPPPPKRWHNNTLLIDGDDALLVAVRDAVTEAGWAWQLRLAPPLPMPRFDRSWLGFRD